MLASHLARGAIILILGLGPAAAEDPETLRQALSGATVVGAWNGTPYRQTFGEDGSTTYVEGGRPSFGSWRIADDGDYCSVWPPAPSENCYGVELEPDGALTWITPGGARQDARILAGAN